MSDVRAPFRYLDNPTILADGSVLRFPYVGVSTDDYGFSAGNRVAYGLRLYKRRRKCRVCRHRHGPTRNVAAVVCCAGSRACSCRNMLQWPTPEQLLAKPWT